MDKIIERIESLIQHCKNRGSYDEIVYEVDGLIFSVLGKNHEIYKNFVSICNMDLYSYQKVSFLIGILQALKNEIIINGIKKETKDDTIEHLHELIIKSSLKKYEDGHYADAVESAIKEINERLKKLFKKYRKEEKDGSDLFAMVFNNDETKALLRVGDMTTLSGKDEQEGYRFLFMGIWKGIRNPKAHVNTYLSKEQAYKRLIFSSMLMEKIDEAIKYSAVQE